MAEQFIATQLAAAWLLAGGSRDPATVAIAVAVAFAESGGRMVVNDSPGETPSSLKGKDTCRSVGPWQINFCDGRDAKNAVRRNAGRSLLDNATAAVVISANGRTWKPWTMFNNGGYRSHLDKNLSGGTHRVFKMGDDELREVMGDVTAADPGVVPEIIPGVPEDVIPNPLEPAQALARALLDPNTWVRVLKVVVGLAALLGGLWLVGSDLAIRTITSAIPTPATGGPE